MTMGFKKRRGQGGLRRSGFGSVRLGTVGLGRNVRGVVESGESGCASRRSTESLKYNLYLTYTSTLDLLTRLQLITPHHTYTHPTTMPQPALPLNKYLSAQLPAVRESFPAGGGATGERKQYDGVLTGVSIVDDFKSLVSSCEFHLSV